MSEYGINEAYTEGWDDCETQYVIPMEKEIKELRELLNRYELKQ